MTPTNPTSDPVYDHNAIEAIHRRWWFLVWSIWTTALASIVILIDRSIISCLMFVGIGTVICCFGRTILRPFSSPFFQWYHNFNRDAAREHRIFELARIDQTDSPEYMRLIEEECFAGQLALPLLFGIFHGVLIGGIFGALFSLERSYRITATQGAFIGIAAGPLLVSLVSAIALQLTVPLRGRISPKQQLIRRGLILAAPLFAIPVGLHCLKHVALKLKLTYN